MITHFQILLLVTTLFLSPVWSCPTNCATCDSSNQCSQCFTGYVVTVNNECQKFVVLQGCRVYSRSGTCAGCINGYNLFSGSCYPPISNCATYGPGNTCLACNSNYLLYYGNCYQQSQTTCGLAQGLYQGACVPVAVRHCLNLTNGSCISCEPSTYNTT